MNGANEEEKKKNKKFIALKCDAKCESLTRYIEFVLVIIFKYYSNIYIGFRRVSDIRADDNDHYNENDVLLPAPLHNIYLYMHTRRKHTNAIYSSVQIAISRHSSIDIKLNIVFISPKKKTSISMAIASNRKGQRDENEMKRKRKKIVKTGKRVKHTSEAY